jgi:type I restriction-modification system DNA methylase subunit
MPLPKSLPSQLRHHKCYIHTNTLAENLADIQEKDRYDIILANPPFGGKERAEVQQNFPIKTGETASLFLQHFIKILKAGVICLLSKSFHFLLVFFAVL